MECPQCGEEVTSQNEYRRDIHGTVHSFCCSHCADDYEMKTTGHLHH